MGQDCRGIIVAICLSAATPSWLVAADPASSAAPVASGVGMRQQRVAAMMQELDQRFLALAKSLEKDEPERAARLLKAFEDSKTSLIEPRMRQIVSLLDSAQLDSAGQEESRILEDVRRLITILLKESEDDRQDRGEIEQLQKWHQEISLLLKDERTQKAETRNLDRADDALNSLAKQIAAVEELLRRERQLLLETDRTAAEGANGLGQLAQQQERIRRDTDFTNNEITKARAAAENGGAAPVKAASTSAAPGPGQKPLAEAARHQREAESNLAELRARKARSAEEQAINSLEQALAELKKEEERLKSPPADALDRLAEAQTALAKKTESLNQQVSTSKQPGKPGEGTCSSCSSSLKSASESMESASKNLKQKNANSASADQKQAEEQLMAAQKEIEKRLAELGEKPEDEALERLETLFAEMLARQQPVTTQTVQFHQEHENAASELRRAERITLRRLSQEESELAVMAGRALELIEADGTTISFPVTVEDLKSSLVRIAGRIEQQETGAATQTAQREIEKTLEELIEALKMARKSGSSSSGQGGNSKPCLLPSTAELKLLRQMQLRVNRQTTELHVAKGQGELDPARKEEIQRVAGMQVKIADMVREIINRQQETATGGLQFPGSELLNLPQ